METINSRAEFEAVKHEINEILRHAESRGGVDNLPEEELEKLCGLTGLACDYERNVLNLYPLKGCSHVVLRLQEEMFHRNLNEEDFAQFLGISQKELNGVIEHHQLINTNLAVKLNEKLGIDRNAILEHNNCSCLNTTDEESNDNKNQ